MVALNKFKSRIKGCEKQIKPLAHTYKCKNDVNKKSQLAKLQVARKKLCKKVLEYSENCFKSDATLYWISLYCCTAGVKDNAPGSMNFVPVLS